MQDKHRLKILKGKPRGSQWEDRYDEERPQEKMLPGGTYVQVLETVPAKRVFAILAHHLGTALVAFDVNPTDGALLDGGFCVCPKEGPRNKMDEKLLGGGGVKNAARTTRVSADQGWGRVG